MISRVDVVVCGGSGGDGAVSFRHEKYVPFGGPDGGDGGSGGDVFVMASVGVDDLALFKRRRKFVAGHGGRGAGGRKHGRRGKDLTVPVPAGTVVLQKGDSGGLVPVADLADVGERVLVARGGRGGLGNAHFATAVIQAPETSSQGKPGEKQDIILELKLATDICIIGYPNSGKSTLLSRISRARPRIDEYLFTTREPVLGVMQGIRRDFIVAEMPGLVEGAHAGKGLGNDFLRHGERAGLLIYLLDGSSESIGGDLQSLYREVALYGANLARKPGIVAVNKTDLPQVQAALPRLKHEFGRSEVPVFYVSALTGQGVLELASRAMTIVEQESQRSGTTLTADLPGQISSGVDEPSAAPLMVFRPRPRR